MHSYPLHVGQYVSVEWLFGISCATKMGSPIQKGSLSTDIPVSATEQGNAEVTQQRCSRPRKLQEGKELKQSICLTDDWLVAEFDCRKVINSAVQLVLCGRPFMRLKMQGYLKAHDWLHQSSYYIDTVLFCWHTMVL